MITLDRYGKIKEFFRAIKTENSSTHVMFTIKEGTRFKSSFDVFRDAKDITIESFTPDTVIYFGEDVRIFLDDIEDIRYNQDKDGNVMLTSILLKNGKYVSSYFDKDIELALRKYGQSNRLGNILIISDDYNPYGKNLKSEASINDVAGFFICYSESDGRSMLQFRGIDFRIRTSDIMRVIIDEETDSCDILVRHGHSLNMYNIWAFESKIPECFSLGTDGEKK